MERVDRVIPIKKNRLQRPLWPLQLQDWLAEQLEDWRRSLQEQDRSPGTVEKYVEAVQRLLA